MADTTKLNTLILKYRRRVNDMTKKDGTFYSLTDMTGTGSIYSGMDEEDNESNAGAQTNQEIADLATDSTNMWLDALAQTFQDSRKQSFPTYSGMTKYVPEYVAFKEAPIPLSQATNNVPGRLFVDAEIVLDTDSYFGYPVSGVITSNNLATDREIIALFSEPNYKSTMLDFKYDELLEDPIYYLTGGLDSSGNPATIVKLEWFPSGLNLQDWPPGSGLQFYTGTFTFYYIQRQPSAAVDIQDILLNPKYHDKILDIMVKKHELIRELTRQ